jgi:hypothetical protein
MRQAAQLEQSRADRGTSRLEWTGRIRQAKQKWSSLVVSVGCQLNHSRHKRVWQPPTVACSSAAVQQKS